jgi:hypothetical protein
MDRKTALIGLFAAALATHALIGTAAAQATETPTEPAGSPAGEQIDNATVLVSSSYDGSTGEATVKIRSEKLQEITVSDAGAFISGGQVAQRTVLVEPGETAKITLPATEAEGYVGVSIATSQTLYAEPIHSSGGLSPPNDSGLAGLFSGIVLMFLSVIGYHTYRKRKTKHSVIRING